MTVRPRVARDACVMRCGALVWSDTASPPRKPAPSIYCVCVMLLVLAQASVLHVCLALAPANILMCPRTTKPPFAQNRQYPVDTAMQPNTPKLDGVYLGNVAYIVLLWIQPADDSKSMSEVQYRIFLLGRVVFILIYRTKSEMQARRR
ncbi:hypothetical protein JB92DRAFT_2979414 [Gautieria morchelliformis]|nr:hypothetical protein JB92DRAFT_2979414 [Gautieria morchelliformis]